MGGYDEAILSSYIAYLDANNLYGHSMLQKLPINNFQWCDNTDIDSLIELCGPNGIMPNMGCFVKCDIEYPAELHDLHNDYPLAPERMLVTQDMLSPYAKALQAKMDIGDDTVPKLVPNLMDKTNYVADIRNLAYYRDMGLRDFLRFVD